MSERRLLSLRRRVAPQHQHAYDQGWTRFERAATARGAHAWRFRAADDAELFLEFLEFKQPRDPRADPDTRALLQALDGYGEAPPALETWDEAPTRQP